MSNGLIKLVIAVGLLVVMVPLDQCLECVSALARWLSAVRQINSNLPKI